MTFLLKLFLVSLRIEYETLELLVIASFLLCLEVKCLERKLSKEIYEFSLGLLQMLNIESYPGILKDVKKSGKNNISLIIDLPVEERLIEHMLKVIKGEGTAPNEILLIPNRKWSLQLLDEAPEEIARLMIEILKERRGKNGEEPEYIK